MISRFLFGSFETENKIFAQETGKVSGKEQANEGTSGVGWYQYIGDDGKVYRVEYEAGVQGFVPKVRKVHCNFAIWTLILPQKCVLKISVESNENWLTIFIIDRVTTSTNQSKSIWTVWRNATLSKCNRLQTPLIIAMQICAPARWPRAHNLRLKTRWFLW